jgi:PKD repeat protein
MPNNLIYYFFDQSTGNPTSWEWNFSDPGSGSNNSSTLQNPLHAFTAPGVYLVCLSIQGDSCQDMTCDSLFVGINPVNCVSYFTYNTNFLTISCEGHTQSLYPTTYSWQMGDPSGTTLTGKNITFTYPAAGTYEITLTTTDSANCSYSSTQFVEISDDSYLYGYITMENILADHGLVELIKVEPGTMTIVDSKELGDSTGMYWFTGIAPGNYYLKAYLTSNSAYFGQYVPTYFLNTVNWTNATLIQLGQPNNPYNISLVPAGNLSPGNGNISGIINQNLKLGENGAPVPNVEVLLLDENNHPLSYTLTDAQGTFSFSNLALDTYIIYPEMAGKNTIPAHIALTGNNPSAALAFTMHEGSIIFSMNNTLSPFISRITEIYPNPATDKINISVSATRDISIIVSIYDMTGQVVETMSFPLKTGENRLKINSREMSSGIYYMKILTPDGSAVTKKFIVAQE